jgi:hypothetical protein
MQSGEIADPYTLALDGLASEDCIFRDSADFSDKKKIQNIHDLVIEPLNAWVLSFMNGL